VGRIDRGGAGVTENAVRPAGAADGSGDGGVQPPEARLYDNPETADLTAKVNAAWDEFSQALTQALPVLPADTELELTLDPTASGTGEAVYTVSVMPSGSEHVHAYAVSNAMLAPEHRLPRAAVGALVALGWSPPGVVAGAAERFGLQLPTEQGGRVAAIVCRTLREIYGTPHPAFLLYSAVAPDGSPVEAPPLGSARPMPSDPDVMDLPGRSELDAMPLREKVTAVIAAMMKIAPETLPVDKDGDIGIRSGSAMVFVRVRDNPPLVDVFSPVLTEINANEKLYLRLSDLTHRMPIGRLYCNDQTVWASVPVFGRDFQATHLMLAVQVMTGLADELDDRLHGEFGGKRFFVETDRSEGNGKQPEDGTDSRTGMYL
jgi:hypothetical protein